MQIKQLHTLINSVTQEVLGATAIVADDLTNVVDLGKQIIDTDNVDSYVKKLINHIGKVVFVDRLYAGGVPSVLMDSWEYGSILQKVSGELPDAVENKSWELTNGTDYSPDVFYQPTVTAKFFNSLVTFEIPVSFTEKQVKQSFSSKEQLNGFITMLTTNVENAMTVKTDALIMRTINNMIGETVKNDLINDAGVLNVELTTPKCVNLIKLYGDYGGGTVGAARALTDPDFVRFCSYIIGVYADRMAKISTLFNVEGKKRFTPADMNRTVLLSDFAKANETFVVSNAQQADKVTLPKHETVPYWQGSGENYDFEDITSINVRTSGGNDVAINGVLGVMFDREALGVSNLDKRVTTNYNAKAEFFNNFYKFDAGYYNDLGQNFVVFLVADGF